MMPLILILSFLALPLGLTVLWVTGMSLTTESMEECWDDYSNSSLIYIIVIPMILALAVNLLFLVSIMKVVVTKLRIRANLSTQQLQVRQSAALKDKYWIFSSPLNSSHFTSRELYLIGFTMLSTYLFTL